jgi:superfamily II DNA or RNA helicase
MSNYKYINHVNDIVNNIFSDENNYIDQKININYNESSGSESETETKSETETEPETETVPSDDLIKIMKINYSYPEQSDPHIQQKLYKKREFYYHRIQPRELMKDYKDIKKFRDMSCGGSFRLRSQQSLLSNFINPETPFRGVVIYHGVGTGKTCSAIAIAEKFKDQVKKYGTKIYILVGGPLIKENWRDEIIKCTGEKYLKDITLNAGYIDDQEKAKQVKQAKLISQQYYKIMSYRSFYKKVLGQKISDKKFGDNKVKKIYRKTAEGEYERDIAIDKIDSLNNTLLIIDEVQNITDNEYGNAVKKIIDNSKNLKIILLSATPMINFADEIIEILNYIRPPNDPVYRDQVFTSDKSHLMAFKDGGQEYLKNMASGYISHFRGLNPLTFAEEVDMGVIPDELYYTNLFRCPMLEFQTSTYLNVLGTQDDSLDRRSQAVSNFCFPGLSPDKKSIMGFFGKDGLDNIKSQLKSNKQFLQKLINDKFFDGKLSQNEQNEIIKDADKNKSISGLMLKKENIRNFSIKFYNALNNLENLVEGKNGAGTAFIYFNLVKVGVELFTEVLHMNGYLEFNEDKNYNINDNIIDAVTGVTYKEFKDKGSKGHFYPATYITLTGESEETVEQTIEEKKKILDTVFNNINNRDGKYLKLVLGSKVMAEGITLENVSEVHVMDVYYNLGKIHQVIGRALRECKHYKMISDENPFPKVKVYRYVVSLSDHSDLTTEEEMYQKAERKYLLIKETERLLKEVSIDCPLNYHGNIFPEEVDKFAECVPADKLFKMNPEERKNALICPTQCDLMKCTYKCSDSKLNLLYYDSGKELYKRITKDKIDYSTFTNILARNEIDFAKEKIKELYRFRYVYTLSECVSKIRKSYTGEKRDLFEDFFVFKALDELIPLSENDFNNYSDTIYDKFNVPGYLIYRNKFYIFQPFEQNEDVPMFYRSTFNSELFNDLNLYTYLKTTDVLSLINQKSTVDKSDKDKESKRSIYNFKDVIEYYDAKPEFDYVGIIDKASIRKRSIDEAIPDTFKLRARREKILEKKRGTGIPSLTGAVCETSKKKHELIEVAKFLGIKIDKQTEEELNESRTSVCKLIRNRLLYLEKYSNNKDKNKYTYLIIPSNHPNYPFPINLEDRTDHIIKLIENKLPFKVDHKIEKLNNGIFEGKRNKSLVKYILKINNTKDVNKYENFFKSNKFELNSANNEWSITIE